MSRLLGPVLGLILVTAAPSAAPLVDCNGNSIPDDVETAVTFAPHQIFAAAAGAQAVRAADLDGDGDLDVLSASSDDDTIAWYENTDGHGAFTAAVPISLFADFAVAVEAADLDGDGDLDVLAASAGDDEVAWFENVNGLGHFSTARVISTQANGAWSVFAADLDGDGDLDVLSASQNDNKLAWYENMDGDGAFGAQRVISIAGDIPLAVLAADLDDDGDLDVLAAFSGSDLIAWHENLTGQGIFGPPQTLSNSANGASAVHAADLDGDGDLDVLSASALDDTIAWYEKADGADSFAPEQSISSTADFVLSVYTADLDGDGDLDVLFASGGDDIIGWHKNLDGQGTYGPGIAVFAGAHGASSVYAADLDGDGDLDVLSASLADDTIAWYENLSDDCNGNAVPDECEPDCNGNGRADGCDLVAGASDCNANQVPDACDIGGGGSADCTGNGIPDACEPDCNASSAADSCDILGGSSSDCSGNGIPDECEPDCNASNAADSCDILGGSSSDCSGDGVPDECQPDCNANGTADLCDVAQGQAFDCNANGVLDSCEVIAGTAEDCEADGILDTCRTRTSFERHVVSTAPNLPRSIFAADLDSDSDFDVLIASSLDDEIAWHANLGGGTFGPQQVITNAADGAESVFAVDLDGDGDLDVLSASSLDDEIAWYEDLTGLGVFGPPRIIFSGADGARSVFAADLDHDGDLDVLSASSLDGRVAWYENGTGTGFFGPPRPIATLAGARVVRAADLDGDGDTDVLALSFDVDTLAWYENLDGAGAFGPPRTITSSADGALSAFTADLDGDADLDVLCASQNDDAIAWYENLDGDGSFGPRQIISTLANGASGVSAADLDGDGDLDALSTSFFDGRVSWYENLDGNGTFGPLQDVFTGAVGAVAVGAADFDGDGDFDVLAASTDDDTVAWHENVGDDCNGNRVPDACDIAAGTSTDCDADGLPDECEPDCNANGLPDGCDIASGASTDCDDDGLPDECEPDCNGNGRPDGCDIAAGSSADCNTDGLPDECEPDCNGNGVADDCDIAGGGSADCDGGGVPDECQPNCNADGVPDVCEIDCNADGVPNECEPDCNANGKADDCDLLTGPSRDCNANGVPDECDTGCPVGQCDLDADRCQNTVDSAPTNPHVCADVDHDLCDDCSTGKFNPKSDGADSDFDGSCDAGDCSAQDGGAWAAPSPARHLTVGHAGSTALFNWQPPLAPGAALVHYDLLRSPDRTNFHAPATCVESDHSDRSAFDSKQPALGAVLYYLVRVENACPGSIGNMGQTSAGVPHTGIACP